MPVTEVGRPVRYVPDPDSAHEAAVVTALNPDGTADLAVWCAQAARWIPVFRARPAPVSSGGSFEHLQDGPGA